ncbi:uncharacterized protein PHACADRAFT_258625 [Phanerochaete carnosa HHB-10118-sp]|uniref:SHSP domain-containing protein n=1 Tax=Phanerochaete carnosa (strain HHB-10118-sp) TaxID=650164 RepID=K5VSY6_PHACS|nr:uncharacterized protein PHACADRAFT_258625 [Phanerochaete carnosa HHB-10118-sp]EKM54633.1 hypothetical protein PHACADRAFT_258625 [Phanerochaete carnosa HHB-10118-sp]
MHLSLPLLLTGTDRLNLHTGHFERRISFGYDADLARVRAEFDGEHLRIIVPRRPALMTYWSSGSSSA